MFSQNSLACIKFVWEMHVAILKLQLFETGVQGTEILAQCAYVWLMLGT